MRLGSLAGLLLLSIALGTTCVLAQEPLTNASIEKMAKAGLGDDVIVSMIQSQPGHYELTPDTLISLKKDGISEKVLAAMAAKNAAPAVAPAAAAGTKDPYEDLDIGVYYKLKDVWTLIPSEAVNWKTGGALKSFATQGIVKGDVNGHLNGKQSATQLRTPLEILIKAPEGSEATDYQLVHMHVNSDNREFRTKTGGVFHASGGATKDAVQFQQTRIAKHVYTVTLPDKLASGGEYGFLAPGLTNSTASGSTGKAYTFHFLE
jgi:hypothetical protein